MDDLVRKTKYLQQEIQQAIQQLHVLDLQSELAELQAQSQKSDFWNDSMSAQVAMQQIARLDSRVGPWIKAQSATQEILDLLQMNDASIIDELQTQYVAAQAQFNALKDTLKFNGTYDNYDAIMSVYAGAGGTDAQDWAQMLLRMYSRYFEKLGWKTTVIEESAGEEAGLKSITLEVTGALVYGKLKGEHGVHRLVRLSPFNSDNLRQTSFAKVDIIPKIDKPDDLEIDEKELKIDVYRAGGHGGQSVNTTDSAVRITHIPTGITVAIQNERSQLQNRETAMTILRSRLAQLQLEQHQEAVSELKGPNQSAEWGNQIRSYVLHPYKQVKDLRTRYETSDPDAVLDGLLEPFIDAYLEHTMSSQA